MEINECILPSGFSLFIEINRYFDFLRNEGYTDSTFFIGREVSVVYSNHKINQTISIVIPEPCLKWKCEITIQKRFFVFSKIISVTDYLKFENKCTVMDQLIACSEFIRKNAMQVIRGERWMHFDGCQYLKLEESFDRCVYLNDLSETELLFWNVFSSFDFLYIEGYHIERYSLCGRWSFLSLKNHIIKQEVRIEWYSLFDVSVKITKYGFLRERDFEIENVKYCFNDNSRSLRDIKRSFLGCQNEMKSNSDFIRQNLMPVIRGEMWIDELLIKLGKTPPVIEKTKERYVRSE